MKRVLPEGQFPIGIHRLSRNERYSNRWTLATQASHIMRWVTNDHYIRDLGLRWADDDPMPDPKNIDHVTWRTKRLRESGYDFIFASILDEAGRPSTAANAAIGWLVLDRAIMPNNREALHIVEFDVHPWFRGVGKYLMEQAVISEDLITPVTLDVAAHNVEARNTYEHFYGFEYALGVQPEWHGVYNTYHLPMKTTAGTIQERLAVSFASKSLEASS